MSATDDPGADKRPSKVKTSIKSKTPDPADALPTVVDSGRRSGVLPPTVIDARGSGGSATAPATVIDTSTAGAPWVATRLVPPLAGQYEVVRELDSGAEAHVLLVRSKTGRQLVYKSYHERHRVVPETGERIARASRSTEGRKHLVEIVKCGEYDSRWWELLEYCELGSLRGHIRKVDSIETIRQLAAALTFAHGKDLAVVHRDLKPENVLVRSLSPLQLVLGDFGLVYDMKPGTVVFAKAERTPGYEPPETFHGDKALITRKTDWWSLGMIAAEMVLGRHLLAPPGGALSADPDEIKKLIWDGVDVSEIKDPRWNRLCRGLLTRKRDLRWDGTQVAEWLKGGSPPVADDVPDDLVAAPTPAAAKAVRPWVFNGKQYTSGPELAAAMQRAWPTAVEVLAPSVAKSTQVKALQELCAELRCSAAVRALSDEVTPSNSADRRLAIVLADLNPMLSPEWRGMRVDRVGLENEARLVVEDGPRATGRLDDLRESGVLGVWPMLAGCEKHGVLADAWAQQCRQLRSAVEAEASRGAGMISEQALRQANAWLLLTCLESGHLAALAKRHAAISVDAARRQEWFRRLHDLAKPGHDAIAMLVSMCYAPVATERQNAKDAEDRRLAAEEARRAKEAADAALAAARTRRATKSLKFQWAATLTLVLTSFVLITLGVTNDPSFIVENAGAMPKFVRDWPTAYAGVGGELSLERAEPQLLYVGIILGLWALVSLVSAFVLRAISRGSRRAFGEFWLSQRWIVFPLAAVCFAAYAPWIIYGGIIAILVVVGLTLAIIIGRVISSG